MKTIYIGNLPFSTTEDTVRELFSEQGEVHSVKLIVDRKTKRSRGFGYVEMDDEPAANAIEAIAARTAALTGRGRKVWVSVMVWAPRYYLFVCNIVLVHSLR